jgi:hypothetical protein
MNNKRHNVVSEHFQQKIIAAYTLLYAGKEEGVFCGSLKAEYKMISPTTTGLWFSHCYTLWGVFWEHGLIN